MSKTHYEDCQVGDRAVTPGRTVTDSLGRKIDFRNTIIIMTSNIGSQYILDVAALDEQVEERVGAGG